MLGKRGQFWDTIIPWIIAVIVIFLYMVLFTDLGGKLGGMGEFFKNWLRFGQ